MLHLFGLRRRERVGQVHEDLRHLAKTQPHGAADVGRRRQWGPRSAAGGLAHAGKQTPGEREESIGVEVSYRNDNRLVGHVVRPHVRDEVCPGEAFDVFDAAEDRHPHRVVAPDGAVQQIA